MNSIDFVYGKDYKLQYGWTCMFKKLIEYKKQHEKNTMVPKEYDKDPKLAGHWVILQRCYYKKDKLLPNQSNWSFDEFDWFWMGSSYYISGIQKNMDDHMFRKLVAYKKAVYKDTMVLPHRYKGG